jgi:hypothetical protein
LIGSAAFSYRWNFTAAEQADDSAIPVTVSADVFLFDSSFRSLPDRRSMMKIPDPSAMTSWLAGWVQAMTMNSRSWNVWQFGVVAWRGRSGGPR